MKSINQIFKNNKKLLNEQEVVELVEYCNELEEQLIENKQLRKFDLEDKLSEVVRDIYISINQIIKDENDAIRFGEIERINFKKCIDNLNDYIQKFSVDNNFEL